MTSHAAPRLRQVVALLTVSGVLSAATIAAGLPSTRLGLDVAIAVVGCAASPVLLWRPVAGTLGLTALAVLSPVATPPATIGALQVARRRRWPLAVATAAAGIAAHAIQGLWRPNPGISYGWWLALIAACYAALVGWGALAQARQALIVSLHERARRAEAEQGRRVAEARLLERRRIAREMHDVLAHRLSLLATYAGALEYRPDAPPEQLTRAAGVVRNGVHQALDELREVITLLRDDTPEAAEAQPAMLALPRLVEEARSGGNEVRLHDDRADQTDLPPSVERAAFRVIQEALTNARKHAPGQPVEVRLTGRPGTGLVIDISNPVVAGPAGAGAGTGLVGLTERVRLTGGQFDHEVTAGEFRVHSWLPWPA